MSRVTPSPAHQSCVRPQQEEARRAALTWRACFGLIKATASGRSQVGWHMAAAAARRWAKGRKRQRGKDGLAVALVAPTEDDSFPQPPSAAEQGQTPTAL